LRDRAGILTAFRADSHPEPCGVPQVSYLPPRFFPARPREPRSKRRTGGLGCGECAFTLGLCEPSIRWGRGLRPFDFLAVGNARHTAKRGSSRCPAPN
jgi:hypothetical protein